MVVSFTESEKRNGDVDVDGRTSSDVSAGRPLITDFVVLPRRRVVERTFSWFGRNRRTLLAFVTLAFSQLA